MKLETPFEVRESHIVLGQPGREPTPVLKTTLQKPSGAGLLAWIEPDDGEAAAADVDGPVPRLLSPPPTAPALGLGVDRLCACADVEDVEVGGKVTGVDKPAAGVVKLLVDLV